MFQHGDHEDVCGADDDSGPATVCRDWCPDRRSSPGPSRTLTRSPSAPRQALSGRRPVSDHGSFPGMTAPPNPYRGPFAAFAEVCGHVLDRERAGQQVALDVAATHVAEPLELRLGLDALGHDVEAERGPRR